MPPNWTTSSAARLPEVSSPGASNGGISDCFECLQHAGRQLVAQGAGQPSLAANLFQAHVQFSKSLWILRFRVAALQLGFGSVDARAILGAFEKASGALAQPAAA